MDPERLWAFLLVGYSTTVLIETPVLIVGLSRVHSLRRKVVAGLWLTACTYPVVILVLPLLISPDVSRGLYLLAAETFAPLAECALFGLAFHRGRGLDRLTRYRDHAAVIAANLISFGVGELWSALTEG